MFDLQMFYYNMSIQTYGGENVNVKERIVAIRLSEKIERNPEYSTLIGLSVINGETRENEKLQIREEEINIRKGKI